MIIFDNYLSGRTAWWQYFFCFTNVFVQADCKIENFWKKLKIVLRLLIVKAI